MSLLVSHTHSHPWKIEVDKDCKVDGYPWIPLDRSQDCHMTMVNKFSQAILAHITANPGVTLVREALLLILILAL